jgi:hypothetical protein
MKKYHKELLIIFTSALVFGATQIYLFSESFNFITVIFQVIGFLIISLAIALIWSIFRLKRWGFLKVFCYSSMLGFVLYLIILSYSTLNDIPLKSKEISNQEKKYKKIINNENEKPIKKVGDVKLEFLNEDNFYENYVYNYAIKFPENYKLNYGIGEYSNIMAYNEINGKQISITTGDNGIDHSFKNQEANEMIENFQKKHLDFFTNEIIKKWKKEGSFQDIKVLSEKVVNFYNKKFIKLTFEATRNLNDIDYLFTVTDYITFFKDYNYHFYFESPKPQNEDELSKWNNLILKTMSKVRISKTITQ